MKVPRIDDLAVVSNLNAKRKRVGNEEKESEGEEEGEGEEDG